MSRKITATEAARNFSHVLNQIRYGGETFVVVRGGEPICRMSPAEHTPGATWGDLFDWLRQGAGDDGFADHVREAQRDQPRMESSPWDS